MPADVQHLLDIGCGNGQLTGVLATKAPNVLGIDINALAIAEAEAVFGVRTQLAFRIGEAEKLDESVDGRLFDCVVSVFTLHNTDISLSLENIKSHLMCKGKVIIIEMYAARKNSFVSFLMDQLILSHFRQIRPLLSTLEEIGLMNVIRFMWWRLKFVVSKESREHMREDFRKGVPGSLAIWRSYFDDILPAGTLRVLMGSVFMYTWEQGSSTK